MIVVKSMIKEDLLAASSVVKSSFIGTDFVNSTNLTNLNKAPYVWFGDPTLDWKLVFKDNKICGFFLSRIMKNNYHLHSLNIVNEYKGEGIGTEIIKFHWKRGMQINPCLDTYTLHVDQQNKFAIKFYKKLGYKRFNYNQTAPSSIGILNWIDNCKKNNDWPLRDGHLLYLKQI
jgi:ribosomal protein S18 acetylase RimI-like enzyme